MMSTSNSDHEEFLLRDHFFKLDKYFLDEGVGFEQLIAGLINQPAQETDRFVTEELTNYLFPENGEDFGMDLVSR